MKKLVTAVAAGVIALAGAVNVYAAPTQQLNPSSEGPRQQTTLDIVDTAVAAGDFTTLAAALEAADLIDTLKGDGPFTVFAPTDAAFAALPAGTVEGLLADVPALTGVLLYHVVSGDVRAADVIELDAATTVGGSDISVEVVNGEVVLNGSVKVVSTDIAASNGVIHVIDAVLLPPAPEMQQAQPAQAMDIVDTAVAAGDFTTLAAALEAADLIDTLKGDGPFTVFAPTDAAFAALPAGTVEGLLADIPALTDVLLYHVVAGDVRAADVVGLDAATTALGKDVSIEVIDGDVVLNGSVKVTATDIVASNGVIHVIDGVLLPPADAAPTAPPQSGTGGYLDQGGSSATLWMVLGLVAGVFSLGAFGVAGWAVRKTGS